MPKIIEGVRENILNTARTMLFTEGYQSISIRAVAQTCGIATGTFYNYFENKEVLIASIMVQDWQIALGKMEVAVSGASSVWDGMDGIYQAIEAFVEVYESIWKQSGPAGASAITMERHQLLCQQIGGIVKQLLCNSGYEEKVDFSVFLAENALSSATKTYLLPHFKEMVETMFPPRGGDHE